ncbi:MAG: lysoplasmalogenase [Desulfobacula sp.]|nr:lysoplasmalogenase [Desulfobacula sp.]
MLSLNRIVYFLFFCFATVFIATLNFRPYPGDFIVKAVPVLSLAVLAFLKIPGIKGKLLGIGFLFSDLGDVLLELDRSEYFVFGLAAFLIAHVFYILVFMRKPVWAKPRSIVVFIIIAYGIILGSILIPKLGSMMIPVVAYLVVILAMGISASLGSNNHFLILTGACFFILSDTIIAVDKFLTPVPFSSFWIMTIYYSAQFCIIEGSLKYRE